MQGGGSIVVGGTRKAFVNDTGDFVACKLDSNQNGAVVSTWKVQYSTGPLVRMYAIKN